MVVAKYGIVILAAGSSSRLGTPKQLLSFQGTTLIRRLTDIALDTTNGPVVVVTGAAHEPVGHEISDLPVHTVHNAHWPEGMGSSVATGVHKLLEIAPQIAGAILAVCDQPFVTPALFESMFEIAAQKNSNIIASSYDDILGTPVLFPAHYFPNLLALKGAEGARKLLDRFSENVISMSFPEGNIDIDTPLDYQQLISGN
jgi:molybdenum cofactor cytidylyltransferase